MEIELKRAYLYCRDLARRKAGNFYYAFVFLPTEKRRAIYSLYAFCQYGDQQVDEFPPEEARIRLDKFRREFDDCLNGEPTSPLLLALRDSIDRFQLPSQLFHEHLDGMALDLVRQRYDNFDELRRYCYLAASTVGLLCVEIFGYDDPQVREYAEKLGIALQLTNILRDIEEDASRGRIYLPRDEMEHFGYSEEELVRQVVNDNFQRLMNFQYKRALEYYGQADKALPRSELRREAASEIMKAVYRELLEQLRQNGFPVFNGRLKLNSWKKALLALNTYLAIVLEKP